jgi:biopolymer transport protein TolQ
MTPPTALQEGKSVLHLVFSSDPVVKVTLGILILFSIISWAIIFYKYNQVKKARHSAERFLKTFDQTTSLEELLTKPAPRDGNPLYQIFSEGIADILRAKQIKAKDPTARLQVNLEHVKKNIWRAERNEMQKLEQLTPFLATTASASPFIGLFGTVWGILTAFWSIGQQKSSSLAVVGPYIAEALIATAVGLAAAIPAVIAYNYFVNKIKALSKEMNDFSIDLEHRIEREFF